MFNFAHHRLARPDDFLLVVKRGPGMFVTEKIKIRFADDIPVSSIMALDLGKTATLVTGIPVFEINGVGGMFQQRAQQ
jgi:hypothetical protein